MFTKSNRHTRTVPLCVCGGESVPEIKIELSAEKQTQKNNLNMLVMLAAPLVMAWYYYGLRALLLTAVCAVSAVVCDFAGGLAIRRKRKQTYDFSALLTGILIALMLPADFRFSFAAAGCAFAVIAVKLPFGGGTSVPFVPAAAGFAFICVCWPADVFRYPAITAQFDLFALAAPGGVSGTSLAAMLKAGDSMRLTPVTVLNLLTGNFSGPMGTGCILVILAASVYFLFTRPGVLFNTLGMLAACGVMALLFPRIFIDPDLVFGKGLFNRLLSSALLELCSGALVFAAFFLLTQGAASPKKPLRRLLYGAFAGTVCMALRLFGVFEEGVCFAVLLADAAWPVLETGLDKYGKTVLKTFRKSLPVPSASMQGGDADV